MARCGDASLGQLTVPSSTPSGYADAVTVGGIEVALSAVVEASPTRPAAAIGRHPA